MLFKSGDEFRGYLLDELGDMGHLILVTDYTAISGIIVYKIGSKSGVIGSLSNRDKLLSNIKQLLMSEMPWGSDASELGKLLHLIMGMYDSNYIEESRTNYFKLVIDGNSRTSVSINYIGDGVISVGYFYVYDGDMDDGARIGKAVRYKLSDPETIPSILREVEQLKQIVDYHNLLLDMIEDEFDDMQEVIVNGIGFQNN